MITGNENQRFVRMLGGKVNCNLNHIPGANVLDCGTRIVGMAGPVDFSAFYHHVEAGVAIQHRDALLNVIFERPSGVRTVDFIVHRLAVREILGDDNRFASVGSERLRFRLGLYNLNQRQSLS